MWGEDVEREGTERKDIAGGRCRRRKSNAAGGGDDAEREDDEVEAKRKF
tara:strand:+ start:728 stop:874 length:147 start_codon:yes stop_codon:yes gene_type:complete